MPLYEYECERCAKIHEVMQKFSDAPMSACPDCAGPVAKKMSMTSFALKGSGWYTTDYKRAAGPANGGKPAATGENGAAAGGEGAAARAGDPAAAGVGSSVAGGGGTAAAAGSGGAKGAPAAEAKPAAGTGGTAK